MGPVIWTLAHGLTQIGTANGRMPECGKWGFTMTSHYRSSQFEKPNTAPKLVNLALQGGGSHGAFTWGVLDRLLEEDNLTIDGITATSAGSINAVVLAHGLSVGGREAAKEALALFWRRMSSLMTSTIVQPSVLDKMLGNFGLDYSPGYMFLNMLCQLLSPYQLNPCNLNLLKNLLEEIVDFQQIRKQTSVKLFFCATNIRTCKLQVFRGPELTVDHVLASSCLPFLMHAIEIGGERYWDGGFVGNPALFPVIYECDACDIVLVHVTPTERSEFPVSANSIFSRMQEVSVSSSLMREMRAIAFVNKLIDQGKMTGGKRILIHGIEAKDVISELPNSSKLNGDWNFLVHLHHTGRRCAEDWLVSNFSRLGIESSVDVQTEYL
jgi:NTE family protein